MTESVADGEGAWLLRGRRRLLRGRRRLLRGRRRLPRGRRRLPRGRRRTLRGHYRYRRRKCKKILCKATILPFIYIVVKRPFYPHFPHFLHLASVQEVQEVRVVSAFNNYYSGSWPLDEGSLCLGNKNKFVFILYFARFALPLRPKYEIDKKEISAGLRRRGLCTGCSALGVPGCSASWSFGECGVFGIFGTVGVLNAFGVFGDC